MAQPERIDLKPIYKNCDWSIVLTFPYVITALSFHAIIENGENDIAITTERLDSYKLKLSLTAEEVEPLLNQSYDYTIRQSSGGGDRKPIAKGKVTIAPFEV